jgi:hypothetical protein
LGGLEGAKWAEKRKKYIQRWRIEWQSRDTSYWMKKTANKVDMHIIDKKRKCYKLKMNYTNKKKK